MRVWVFGVFGVLTSVEYDIRGEEGGFLFPSLHFFSLIINENETRRDATITITIDILIIEIMEKETG